MKEKLKLLVRVLVFILCIVVMFFGVMFVMNKDQNKKELLELPNPLTEVKSSNEMKDYLGFEVPVIPDKEVDKYYVIGTDKHATHARIIYKDKSQFEMEEGNSDVSGIYGGIKQKEESIGGVKVILYKYNDIIYGTWSYVDYSYSYSKISDDENQLNLDINEIMKKIR